MSLSMYDACVPPLVRALNNLDHILQKGEAFAEARKIDPAVLVNARLAPDMFPLSRQVQIACDMLVRGAARLGGQDFPNTPDTETDFAQLRARIGSAIAFVEGLPKDGFAGAEDRQVAFQGGQSAFEFTGPDYLFKFVIPNVYFHITAAYLILRHNGVELGKMDFLGKA